MNVSVLFLDQNIDLWTPLGRMLFHILGAVAEFERNLIEKRTQEGRIRAMLHGTRSGKRMHGPLKGIPEKAIIQKYREGTSIKALAAEYKLRRSIETMFRVRVEYRIKTKSKDIRVRYFLLAYGQLVESIWYLFYHEEVSFKWYMKEPSDACTAMVNNVKGKERNRKQS